MRILVVGATGTIGRAVVAALSSGNEIVAVSRQSTAVTVDLADPASIRERYRSVGKVDAVACAAGQAKFAPLAQLSDIVDKLSAALLKILNRPDVREKMLANYIELTPSDPATFRAMVRKQLDVWGGKVKDAGIQPE